MVVVTNPVCVGLDEIVNDALYGEIAASLEG